MSKRVISSKLYKEIAAREWLFFGKCIRSERRDRQMNARDYAKWLGISPATLCRIERGAPPSVQTYCQIVHRIYPELSVGPRSIWG